MKDGGRGKDAGSLVPIGIDSHRVDNLGSNEKRAIRKSGFESQKKNIYIFIYSLPCCASSTDFTLPPFPANPWAHEWPDGKQRSYEIIFATFFLCFEMAAQ